MKLWKAAAPAIITRRGFLVGAAALAAFSALPKSAQALLQVNQLNGFNAGGGSTDLLLAFFSASSASGTVAWPAGWTELYDLFNSGGTEPVGSAAYRIADGSEGSCITVTTSASGRSSHTSFRIRDYLGVPEAATVDGGSAATTHDPPNLTPSWGAALNLWIAACHSRSTAAHSGYPAAYGNTRTDVNTSYPSTGTAQRTLNAASENPSTFSTSSSVRSVSATVGIRPSGAAAPTVNNVTGGDTGASASTSHTVNLPAAV